MLVHSRASHVTGGRPGSPSTGALDTVLTPSGSSEPAILIDNLATTYAQNASASAMAAFAFTREDAGDRLFLANKLYIYGYNFYLSSGNYLMQAYELFNAASPSLANASYLTAATKLRYNYAQIYSVAGSNAQAKLYEFYTVDSMINKPVLTPAVNRSGARYVASLGLVYDNSEKFVAYDAKARIKVFLEAQYLAEGFDPEVATPVYSQEVNTSVNESKNISLSCYNTSLLSEQSNYRMYYCVDLSNLGSEYQGAQNSYSTGWLSLDFTTVVLPKPPVPAVNTFSNNHYATTLNFSVDTSSMDASLTAKDVTIERAEGLDDFMAIDTIKLDANKSAVYVDNDFNPSVDTYYRLIFNTTDVNGDTLMSEPSAVQSVNHYSGQLIASQNAQILDAFFTDGTELGTFEDNNTTLWAQGEAAPQIMLGTKHLQKGTIAVYLRDEQIELGNTIINDNGPVKMIDPDGAYHVCILSDTKNALKNVLERRSILTATFQDIE